MSSTLQAPTAPVIPDGLTEAEQLNAIMAAFVDNPLAYVYWDFPWGEPGTPLADSDGPDTWQRDVLMAIEDELHNPDVESVRLAVGSGWGIGKGALVAMIVKWFMNTRIDPQIVLTANTGTQLRTKTWREVAKWHAMSRTSHLQVCNQDRMYHVYHPNTWQATPIAWDANQPEAFSGTHERPGHVLMIFDESSSIPDVIWQYAEGIHTAYNSIQLAFGNRTRSTGRFHEVFPGGRYARLWRSFTVDSRTAKMTNKNMIKEWIETEGEDSDYVRVFVKGQPPVHEAGKLITDQVIRQAQLRHASPWNAFPRILGVDIGRSGSRTVAVDRQGAKIHAIHRIPHGRTDETAHRLIPIIQARRYDIVFIDAPGIGWGVIDTLWGLGFEQLVRPFLGGQEPVWSGSNTRYYNRRAEVWGLTRNWLETIGSLPEEQELKYVTELTAELQVPDFTHRTNKLGHEVILLEPKEKMAGLVDHADALTLTFAEPVMTQESRGYAGRNDSYAQGSMGASRGGQSRYGDSVYGPG